MDRRQSPRIEVQLPVQVWGLDAYGQPFTDPAVVINMSTGGLVLQGVRRRIRAGELLDIRIGDERGQFRVVWAGRPGTIEAGELGLERLPEEPYIWDVDPARCGHTVGNG